MASYRVSDRVSDRVNERASMILGPDSIDKTLLLDAVHDLCLLESAEHPSSPNTETYPTLREVSKNVLTEGTDIKSTKDEEEKEEEGEEASSRRRSAATRMVSPISLSTIKSSKECSNRQKTQHALEISLANERLGDDVFDVSFPWRHFQRILALVKTISYPHQAPTRQISKVYLHGDMIYELQIEPRVENDVRCFSVDPLAYINSDKEKWCAAITEKKKVPVTAFPCSMNLQDVRYTMTTTYKITPTSRMVFESYLPASPTTHAPPHTQGTTKGSNGSQRSERDLTINKITIQSLTDTGFFFARKEKKGENMQDAPIAREVDAGERNHPVMYALALLSAFRDLTRDGV